MAVIPNKDISIIKEGDELELTLTNGDLTKFKEAMQEWKFKDPQSLLRFTISCLKNSEDKKTIAYIKGGMLKSFAPATDLIEENIINDAEENS